MYPANKKARITALKRANKKYVRSIRNPTAPRFSQKPRVPTVVRLGRQPLPLQLKNTLKYVGSGGLTMSSGFGKLLFIANSLYSPENSGGHQPLYFDQLAALYDHYTVLKCRIKATVVPNTNFSMIASLYQDDDTSTKTDAVGALEMPGAQGFAINPSVARPPPMYLEWDAAKVFGPNPQAQDSLQGTATTSPSELSYFVLSIYDSSGGSGVIFYMVEMEFDVVWDELKTVTSS